MLFTPRCGSDGHFVDLAAKLFAEKVLLRLHCFSFPPLRQPNFHGKFFSCHSILEGLHALIRHGGDKDCFQRGPAQAPVLRFLFLFVNITEELASLTCRERVQSMFFTKVVAKNSLRGTARCALEAFTMHSSFSRLVRVAAAFAHQRFRFRFRHGKRIETERRRWRLDKGLYMYLYMYRHTTVSHKSDGASEKVHRNICIHTHAI